MHDLQTNEQKAIIQKNIKFLIQDYFYFRVYIKFKPDKARNNGNYHQRHFYGNEHRCTYLQCMARKIPHIQLDRLAGYQNLIELVEKAYKGQHIKAQIYGRDPATGNFDVMHRRYDNGILDKETVNDPVLDTSMQFRILYYKVQNNRIVILEEKPEEPQTPAV